MKFKAHHVLTASFSGQFRRQCMHFGKCRDFRRFSAFGQSFGHDSATGLSKLVALLPNSFQIVHNWWQKRFIQGWALGR